LGGVVSELNERITRNANDVLQKYTCALLRDVMPEFYGFKTGRVKELINPELPEVHISGGGTDMVFLMEDGTYLHLGFETGKDKNDIVRHLSYDARLIQRDGRVVNTVIVYTADVVSAPPGLRSNTLVYTPHIILMRDYDGDLVYNGLTAKMRTGQELTDRDILDLVFLPLMKHSLPRRELAASTIRLAETISDSEKRNLCVAAAFAFASSCLDEADTEKLREVLKMTNLGALLVMDAVMDAVNDRTIELAKKMLKRGVSVEAVMEDAELDEVTVRQLQEELVNG